jgi:RpiB/LacA/LacB family sugar-phosphate isomerase
MKIFIGADHRGFPLKKQVGVWLAAWGHEVVDLGTHTEGECCDYPQVSRDVGMAVVGNPGSRGILLCMTGLGHSIAANKVPGVYAALVYNTQAALFSRQHNDSNVLVLGSKFVDDRTAREIIQIWLSTAFEGGRHLRRKEQIQNIEKEFSK